MGAAVQALVAPEILVYTTSKTTTDLEEGVSVAAAVASTVAVW